MVELVGGGSVINGAYPVVFFRDVKGLLDCLFIVFLGVLGILVVALNVINLTRGETNNFNQ